LFITTHKIIAEHIYDALTYENININKNRLIIGNMIPDSHLDFINEPHYYDLCFDNVKDILIELTNSKMSIDTYSYKIGVICHYISDWFCYPHEQNWHFNQGDTKAHILYEKKEAKIAKNKIILPKDIKIEKISDEYIRFFFDELLDEYKKAQSYERDLVFSVSVCNAILEKVFLDMSTKDLLLFD
jgi:hypothetical protein